MKGKVMSNGFISPQLETSSEVSKEIELGEVRDADVPVVVLGANIAGLAAAVAIRSRTGRAVCVIDVDGKVEEAERESNTQSEFLLSPKSLDAVRAINADVYRALLESVAEKTGTPDSIGYIYDFPQRIPVSLLKDVMISHLTAGTGGSSFFWRSSPLKYIKVLPSEGNKCTEENPRVVIVFENQVSIRARLVVVATSRFPFVEQEGRTCVEGLTSLPEGFGDGLWLVKSPNDPDVPELALLGETEKQRVTIVASFHDCEGTLSPDPTRDESVAAVQKGMVTLQSQDLSELNDGLLSAVLEEIANPPALVRSESDLKGIKSNWGLWGGRLILTGPAAHPWASSVDETLELDLEDAAQLGCSLFDWKFATKLASDRFQSIRKWRMSSITRSSRIAKSWNSESFETSSGASTVAASSDSCFEDDEIFVPTRDAYAELLPALTSSYEVEEVEFSKSLSNSLTMLACSSTAAKPFKRERELSL